MASLAFPNHQHYYSCALGPLGSKTALLEHKHCDTETVDLITEKTPKPPRYGRCIQRGYSGQRGDSCPEWLEQGSADFITLLRTGHNLKLLNCLFLEFST